MNSNLIWSTKNILFELEFYDRLKEVLIDKEIFKLRVKSTSDLFNNILSDSVQKFKNISININRNLSDNDAALFNETTEFRKYLVSEVFPSLRNGEYFKLEVNKSKEITELYEKLLNTGLPRKKLNDLIVDIYSNIYDNLPKGKLNASSYINFELIIKNKFYDAITNLREETIESDIIKKISSLKEELINSGLEINSKLENILSEFSTKLSTLDAKDIQIEKLINNFKNETTSQISMLISRTTGIEELKLSLSELKLSDEKIMEIINSYKNNQQNISISQIESIVFSSTNNLKNQVLELQTKLVDLTNKLESMKFTAPEPIKQIFSWNFGVMSSIGLVFILIILIFYNIFKNFKNKSSLKK